MVNRRTSKFPFSVNLSHTHDDRNAIQTYNDLPKGYKLYSVCVYTLGWFLHSAVGVEGLQLVLDGAQGVSELPVVECNDGLLDPLQQFRGQRLVLLNQLVRLDRIVQHLHTHTHFLLHLKSMAVITTEPV